MAATATNHDHRRASGGIAGGDADMPACSDDGDSGGRDGDDGAACAMDEDVGARDATNHRR